MMGGANCNPIEEASMSLPEGVNGMNVVYVLLGVAVVCAIWIAANFVFKMTMKVFALGCL